MSGGGKRWQFGYTFGCLPVQPGEERKRIGKKGYTWVVHCNAPYHPEHLQYMSNYVWTTKYTAVNFIPKFLFKQFRSVANVYFLIVACVSFSPLVPYIASSVLFPLLVVIGATMAKDGIEDWRRKRQEKELLIRKHMDMDMDDEYAKLIRRMNPPRVVIDNESSEDATIIQVDCVNKHGSLLQVVQFLTDLNLVIKKAYISSDCGWFMDVFNVIDHEGKKIRDEQIIDYVKKTLEAEEVFVPSTRETVGLMPAEEHTVIELSGRDRPGLLSEVCAVLADLHCNVVNAEIWTHNARAAAVVHVTDDATGFAIEDSKRLSVIKELLSNVLKGSSDLKTAKETHSPPGFTHRERRLHQIMFADRDFVKVRRAEQGGVDEKSWPHVTVLDCSQKDYTVIIMRSRDRPKLLFDTVCTLTDMQYVIFHGVVHTGNMEAYQEYYIRHVDGLPISSEAEKERVMQCLEAAIERRSSVGLELELCTDDRVGLLSDITRIFRENSLSIKRAEISTKSGKVKDIFHVTDVTGNPVDAKTVESIRQQVGQHLLHVKWNTDTLASSTEEKATSHLFGNLFKARTLQNFKLIKSCN